jgi:hypothetical protein
MMHRQVASALVIGGILALVTSGCGRGGGPTGVKVTGSVVMGGKAQGGTRVGFIPLDLQKMESSRGATTNAEGKFELLVEPGEYAVILSRMVDKNGNVPGESDDPTQDFTQLEASGALRQSFPEKYTDPGFTPLKVQIPPGGTDLPPFEVSG